MKLIEEQLLIKYLEGVIKEKNAWISGFVEEQTRYTNSLKEELKQAEKDWRHEFDAAHNSYHLNIRLMKEIDQLKERLKDGAS